jgi:Tfp pilus assembly protein PilF
MLSEKVLTLANDNVGSRVAAIRHELSRGNMHSAKAAFERAVSSDASKFNPWLWVSYIRFCRSQETLRKKAKEVFYRALRHCPWSKEVMLEAFATLAGDLGSDELKAVFNTMTSKGLRIHVDLEDYLAKRQAERHREEKRKR